MHMHFYMHHDNIIWQLYPLIGFDLRCCGHYWSNNVRNFGASENIIIHIFIIYHMYKVKDQKTLGGPGSGHRVQDYLTFRTLINSISFFRSFSVNMCWWVLIEFFFNLWRGRLNLEWYCLLFYHFHNFLKYGNTERIKLMRVEALDLFSDEDDMSTSPSYMSLLI